MKLLPLGSVIKINEIKTCVIGYSFVEKDNTTIGGYFVVSYPLGFINIDKVFFVPQNSVFETLSEGYKTISSEKILNVFAKSFALVKKVSYKDLVKFNNEYKKLISIQKEGKEE